MDVSSKPGFNIFKNMMAILKKPFSEGVTPDLTPGGRGGADRKGQIDISIEIKDLGAKTFRYLLPLYFDTFTLFFLSRSLSLIF